MSDDIKGWTKNPVFRYVIVTGNVIDGFEFSGPFITEEEAYQVADSNEFQDMTASSPYVVAPLMGPL